MALTLLQIATRIACIPTTSYVISSYSNVRLQQPSMATLTSVESQMVNDMSMMFDSKLLKDEAQSMDVIDIKKSNDNEKLEKNLMSDKLPEIFESSISINDMKNGEEKLSDDILKFIEEITEASIQQKDAMQSIETLQHSNNSELMIIDTTSDDIMTTSESPLIESAIN